MKLKWKFFTKLLLFITIIFFYCEYFIYFVVIYQCSWPSDNFQNEANPSMIKTMFLADTHLLGPYRGHWFDKLRREWQMYRSFQSAVYLLKPDVVFILGDLFDEGQWCSHKQFKEYIERFNSLFNVPKSTELYVVPGNHDVGFHYKWRYDLLGTFEQIFNISTVNFLNLKGNYFILINSMAMEGDNCYFCYDAEHKLQEIARNLKCLEKGNCKRKIYSGNYSRPIILQHFPMYRKSDAECNERDEAPSDIKNTLFKEKWDCLSEDASEMIYRELKPRAIFAGHIHHGCHTIHKEDIHEYTLSSFSWRNKNNPTFIVAKITPNNYVTEKCDLPKESTVIFLYSSSVLLIIVWIVYELKKKSKREHHTKNY